MSELQYVEHNLGEAYVVGDHLALDLINTQAILHGQVYEFWHTDEDIVRWLARLGVMPKNSAPADVAPGILEQAKQLRQSARELIMQRKQDGSIGNPAMLNRFLRAYQSFPQLEVDGAGTPQLLTRTVENTEAQLLGQVALAVAQLLTEGDFDLVKKCEHPECVMWFYDRTKAHKRRWCSMAMCGNRYKAAQFRKRSAAAA